VPGATGAGGAGRVRSVTPGWALVAEPGTAGAVTPGWVAPDPGAGVPVSVWAVAANVVAAASGAIATAVLTATVQPRRMVVLGAWVSNLNRWFRQ